jgi:glycogen debranching enzyme
VWPHDNALIAAGLMRYGFVEEAQKIAFGLLEAAAFLDDGLPELFCGPRRIRGARAVSELVFTAGMGRCYTPLSHPDSASL